MTAKSTFYKALEEVLARRREAYEPANLIEEGFLQVSALHKIWYGVYGNNHELWKQKKNICLMVHGGPGGGCSTTEFFRKACNPEKWVSILVDQRGSGKSTPFAEVKENTTFDLVEDFEKLRNHLSVDSWTVFGGSWGSTLGLAYAITHPIPCRRGLILRGIFIVRSAELKFLYQEGASLIFPEAWEQYRDMIPVEERGDFIAAYHKRLFGDDEEVKLKCAQSWSVWEGRTCQIVENSGERYGEPSFALPFARIENHYFTNMGFWPDGNENWIYDNAHRLKDVPVFAVHGRMDMVCVIDSFHRLKKAIPHMDARIAPLSGHSAGEPDIMAHLLDATDRFLQYWE